MMFEPPQVIHTDQGRHFQNAMIKRLMNFLWTQHSFTTAYYPEANGIVECQNQTIMRILRKLCSGNKTHWPWWLSTVAFYYNTTTHSTVGTTPYSLVFGKDSVDDVILQNLYDQIDAQESTWEINEKHATEQKTVLNRKCQKRQEKKSSTQALLEVGDLVWVYHSQPCRKLDAP